MTQVNGRGGDCSAAIRRRRERMLPRGESRIGAMCAIAGSALLFVGTSLQSAEGRPERAPCRIHRILRRRSVGSQYLTQLAGIALVVVALLFLAQ